MEAVIDNQVIVIGSVYFNQVVDFGDALESLQSVLNLIELKYDDNVCIIGGDFNAWVAEHNAWPDELLDATLLYPERSSFHKKVSPRGHELLEFMEFNNFILINGYVTLMLLRVAPAR